jgi:hypothetical protein
MCTLDPHVPMLKGWMGPSSFPRIMSLEVVFQICFGSIKMMGTRGVLVPRRGQLSYSIIVSKRDSCVQQYLLFDICSTWKLNKNARVGQVQVCFLCQLVEISNILNSPQRPQMWWNYYIEEKFLFTNCFICRSEIGVVVVVVVIIL